MSSDEDVPFNFNLDEFKRRRGPTKEQRDYGIWADENESEKQYKKSKQYQNELQEMYANSSDDDEILMRTGFSLSGLGAEKDKPKNTAGSKHKFMNFVSGGIKAASLKKDVQIVYDPKAEAEEKAKKLAEEVKVESEKTEEAAKDTTSGTKKSETPTDLGKPTKTYSLTTK